MAFSCLVIYLLRAYGASLRSAPRGFPGLPRPGTDVMSPFDSPMTLKTLLSLVAALLLATPLVAQTEPAVQPGGDIPANFQAAPPFPKTGDIPRTFTPPRGEFQYE